MTKGNLVEEIHSKIIKFCLIEKSKLKLINKMGNLPKSAKVSLY